MSFACEYIECLEDEVRALKKERDEQRLGIEQLDSELQRVKERAEEAEYTHRNELYKIAVSARKAEIEVKQLKAEGKFLAGRLVAYSKIEDAKYWLDTAKFAREHDEALARIVVTS